MININLLVSRTIVSNKQTNKWYKSTVCAGVFVFRCSLTLLTVVMPLSSQVTVVRQEYEEKIKGLMPADLRQELEDTITSLKAQVRPDCLPDTDQIQAGLEQTC